MRKPRQIAEVLESRGFVLHHYVGRLFGVGFFGQCCIVVGLAAGALLVASVIDHSLTLPGRDVGLLEHPAIWAFLVLQLALPLSIRHSLKKLPEAETRIREITNSEAKPSGFLVSPLLRFLSLQTNDARLAATIVYCVGLGALVWNTYQNQRPGIIVPYDFWDSTTFFWGFWITRVYKLYLFVLLLPYLAMIHLGTLIVTLREIRSARLSGKLKLEPFHPDGVGGLGFIPGLVTTPIILTVLVGSLPTAAAFEVHRAVSITPVLGLTILVLWTVLAYIVPTLFLRSDIVAMKRETIGKLRLLEQAYYSRIVDNEDVNFGALRKGNEAVEYFDKICLKIQSIPDYPHLKRVLRYIGLALTPSLISLGLKFYEYVLPIMSPLLRKL